VDRAAIQRSERGAISDYSRRQGVSARAALGTQAGTSIRFAGFFVVFATTHFLFDSAAFDQLAEAAHSLLNALTVSKNQLYHCVTSFQYLNN
jgi:hypothetical protein